MATRMDDETIGRLRKMPPEKAFKVAKSFVYSGREIGSEDFLDAYEQLVEHGILTWDQVEEFDGRLRE
jgi:hypothetical protein